MKEIRKKWNNTFLFCLICLLIELETRLALAGEEKDALHNSCAQWENEVDRLKFNGVELRRRLEDSQAALHELGRENQSLQVIAHSSYFGFSTGYSRYH